MSDDLISIEVDGQTLEAKPGEMVIQVTDRAGIHVPRFCYHNKLSIAANCRMCLVEVEKAPKPLPACATPVMDGMKVSTSSALARRAQKGVMEFLLINHPLDCPICDQGGECELQDVAMGYGGDVSAYADRKRVMPDPDLGPLIATDMTRCIHCTRCVRFGEEVAGMRELGATGRGEITAIGTYIEKSVDSELSGNVIDLCPVGALTSKPFRYRARAWELDARPTIAAHDGVGSNINVHTRRGAVQRVVPGDNEAVNEVWISDRDRFSYQGLNHDRLTSPMVRSANGWQETDWETALQRAAEGLRESFSKHGPETVGALVSPSSTTEEAALIARIMRGFGSDNIDSRVHQGDFRNAADDQTQPGLGMELADLENADAVLLIGSHPRKDMPLLGHRLRKAAGKGAKVMSIGVRALNNNYDLAEQLVAAPSRLSGELAALAAELGVKVDGALPAGDGHKAIAAALKDAESAVVLIGASAIANGDYARVRALASAVAGASDATIGSLRSGANAAGCAIAGAVPTDSGKDWSAMIDGGSKAVVLYGIEPDRDAWDASTQMSALEAADFVLSFSAWRSDSLEAVSDVILPIAASAETDGSFVNVSGLWQHFAASNKPPGDARPGWKVLRVLGNVLDLPDFEYMSCADVLGDLSGVSLDGAIGDSIPEAVADDESGLERISELPIYGCDAQVRRSPALQATADAHAARMIAVNAETVSDLGLADGESVTVGQGERSAQGVLSVDAGLPDGCVAIAAASELSAQLGAACGRVTLSKSEGGMV